MSNSDHLFQEEGPGFVVTPGTEDGFIDQAQAKLLVDPSRWQKVLPGITRDARIFAATHGLPATFVNRFTSLQNALLMVDTNDRGEFERVVTVELH